MPDPEPLLSGYPGLRAALCRVPLAALPTPVRLASIRLSGADRQVWIKQDNLTGEPYGGNKVRKLEYLFGRMQRRRRDRVATFGAVGSNHALATALYARKLGHDAVCFLSHQTRTRLAAQTLNMHLQNGTLIVRFGGDRQTRLRTLREHLWNRNVEVIPMGGSSWAGTVGALNAGLELAGQVRRGELPAPDRIYVATGTMGTAAGLALGLALARLPTVVHAVRVSHSSIANEQVLERLLAKTAAMLHRIDPGFPATVARQARIVLRHEYFAPGYAHSNRKTDAALALAAEQLALSLEQTYTGKAMAAMLDDLGTTRDESRILFWNTYHSRPLPADSARPARTAGLPDEFLAYFD